MNAKTDKIENGTFRITQLQCNPGASKGPKVRMTLQNKGYASLNGICWFDLTGYAVGQVVIISGDLGEYQSKAQLTIRQIEVAATYDESKLVPSYGGDVAALEVRLTACLALITDDKLRKVASALLDAGSSLGKNFRLAPASPADISHEPYMHGLFQHTLEVTEVAYRLAQEALRMRPTEYGMVNLSHLVFGALLHDIAKTTSYEYGNQGIRFAVPGLLSGHLIHSYSLVHEAMIKEGGFADADLHKILHIIASHHGYESDNPPRTLEAILVHHADYVCSKLGSTYGLPHKAPF